MCQIYGGSTMQMCGWSSVARRECNKSDLSVRMRINIGHAVWMEPWSAAAEAYVYKMGDVEK